ncbi:hypothetical protein OIO90_004200 [Microbotryomycetes sp. JL221]|nr:hypothetical protein OIO90_004200 [Microbotryomycetes sp. JL221]
MLDSSGLRRRARAINDDSSQRREYTGPSNEPHDAVCASDHETQSSEVETEASQCGHDDSDGGLARDELPHDDSTLAQARRSSVHSVLSSDSRDEQDRLDVNQLLTGSRNPLNEPENGQTDNQRNVNQDESTTSSEDRMCRICFLGQEEEHELGRLFSPCKCSGTSRYVHVACLDRWRSASANSMSLLAVTCILFTLIVYLSGFAANSVLAFAERRRARTSGTFFEDLFVSDHVILSEGVREAVDLLGKQLERSKYVNPVVAEAQNAGRHQPVTRQRTRPITSKPLATTTAPKPPRWLLGTLLHFTKGLSLIGILSMFQTYVATTFVSPLGRMAFRAMRPRGRGGAGRGADEAAAHMSQIVVVVFVILGAVKAILHLYQGVKWSSRRLLRRVSDLVLEV